MNRILILGGGLQGLSVARSLWEIGNEIVVVASKEDVTYHSRYVSFFIDRSVGHKDMLSFLCSVVLEHKCKVIIPMSDTLADFLSVNKLEIESKTCARCAIENYMKFKIAYDKGKLLKLCEKYSIPHPKTISLTYGNLQEASLFVGFPALIKPNHSVGARGITLVNNLDELILKYETVEKEYGSSSLQSYVNHADKPYYNVMLYRDSKGEILARTILEIQRFYPIKGGSSSYGVTVDIPELVILCNRVLDALDWHGFADFDVLKNEKGEYLIIEMNPRVPASLRAAAISGINFPELMVNDCLGLLQNSYDYSSGKKLRYLGLDIMWFIASDKRFSCKPSWFCFWEKNLYYQEGGIKDLKAMCFSLWGGLKKICSSKFRKSKSGM